MSHLKKFASFEFDTIECVTHDNNELAYKWAEYIAENNIDLAFAIGKKCTDTLCSLMATRNHKIPIISAGVPEEFYDENIEQIQKKTTFTGITSTLGWPKRIELLKKVYPQLKRVLILFRSIDEISHRNLKEKNILTAALRKHHVSWEMHHITNIEKSCELTKERLHGIDCVIVSHSSELIPYASIVAQECEKHNVPVFSPVLDSSDAFIGISSPTEREIGRHCAQQAMQVLEDGKSASDIPIHRQKEVYSITIQARKSSRINRNFCNWSYSACISIYPNNTTLKKRGALLFRAPLFVFYNQTAFAL